MTIFNALTAIILTAQPILPTPPTGTPGELAQGGITFFSLWIARVGGIVAFIGAIKFALGIKSDDAREMVQAVLTMVSGFMIVSAVTNLNIFEFGSNINTEFQAIMAFITKWTTSAGSVVALIGGIMFALAIKDQNAATKISGLKTLAAGFIVVSVSQILPMFV